MNNTATMWATRTTEDQVPHWITAKDAAVLLGVHPNRITQLIKEGRLHAHPHPLDKRSKVLDRAEVEELLSRMPRPLDEDEADP